MTYGASVLSNALRGGSILNGEAGTYKAEKAGLTSGGQFEADWT